MNDVTPHTWRHSAAMQGRAAPWETAGYLGMTVEMLIRVYGHHAADQYANVHRAISRPSKIVKDKSEQNVIPLRRNVP
jgi:integrase